MRGFMDYARKIGHKFNPQRMDKTELQRRMAFGDNLSQLMSFPEWSAMREILVGLRDETVKELSRTDFPSDEIRLRTLSRCNNRMNLLDEIDKKVTEAIRIAESARTEYSKILQKEQKDAGR